MTEKHIEQNPTQPPEEINIQKALPLTEAVFLILLSIAPKPKHGYAIMKEVESLSSGRVVLSTGTLYGALKRLLDQAWIEAAAEADGTLAEEGETPRGRKAYQLTDWGRRILQAETARMASLTAVAEHQLAGLEGI